MAVITFKCSDQEKEAFQDYCDKKGISISVELRALINNASGNEPDKIDINTLHERVKALEANFKSLSDKPRKQRSASPKKKPEPRKDPTSLGKLITLEEAVTHTGYTKSTLVSKFSKADITAVSRVDGNRKGLYSKSEVVEKIGYNN